MPRPPFESPPIGLLLTSTARAVSRAFDGELAAAGGSLPTWLIMVSLKTRQLGNQRELAAAVGIQGPTLTHHLNTLEVTGLITRRRDPDNRRVHLVELTEDGEAAFKRMAAAAMAFDARLRAGIAPEEIASLRTLLGRLAGNLADGAGEASVDGR
ncbi:winged helix-turn-helix transcriptional regulator [Frankia sp. CNm7]|uniref:Winged helix-turn-helix transcriptional regulator n=1 Tax=Frankia nepalensis TaxID=1836974 RepID=A0A937RAW0_9ACTN|nr:MarR family winged helix-turn-helix transcriptional regulator [Frankia nepalensis]MBL7497118.1 winged helix-turn-helix transcriptional regulator [Frankia nepalensis]MBL7510145.1 winged helix-turn-helix transcriptional regulator [Frankia nepalensis]MBL7520284.1 winged helix-turn-helix transcriptional regulator [Frankia nepalensis]MBL7627080.1 winged helix-turn-helix transcriptional regulator [Frankia nepalensis]